MSATILIVEDEETLRFTFQAFLDQAGYRVVAAEDYGSALEIISLREPDLIICDIILNRRSGIDLLREVRARGLLCQVVMITGQPSIDTAAESVRLGAYDYLPKPVRKEALLRVSEQALKLKDLFEEKAAMERDREKYRVDLDAIFINVQEGIVTVGPDQRLARANHAFGRICGFNPAEAAGRKFSDLPFKCRRACRMVLEESLRKQEAVGAVRLECRHQDRPAQVVVVTCSPLRDGDSRFGGLVMMIRDKTREAGLERELRQRGQYHRIVGQSSAMQDLYAKLDALAGVDSTVLIMGESGTGKELAADALHFGGARADGPFVKVNCSALSETLLASELFGHAKGAFTGAVEDKKGRFELAHHGTILLDEIGDISPRVQLKLLRVLQEREFERVGSSIPIKVDVRVIATTNRNLPQMVERGEFREDLYYRLKVLDLKLPPLRERRADIASLTDHFCAMFNARFSKGVEGVSSEALRALTAYPWPGNVRELQHALEHAFVLCPGNVLLLGHLPKDIREYLPESQITGPRTPPSKLTPEDILEALRDAGGNKAKAARILGMSRRTIYRKLAMLDPVVMGGGSVI